MTRVRVLFALPLMALTALVSGGVSARADVAGSPVDNSQESGYTSPYTFANTSRDPGSAARRAAELMSMGAAPAGFKARYAAEVAKQRRLYQGQQPGEEPPPGVPTWKSIGPTGNAFLQNGPFKVTAADSGLVAKVLQSPASPNTVYVVSEMGGIWKTNDFGARAPRWTAMTDGLISTQSGSAALGSDPSTIYYGIGSAVETWPAAGGVMYTSHDGARTWSPFANLAGAGAVTEVVVDSSTGHDVVLVGTDFGLFRSLDGGATYTQAASIPASPQFTYVWGLVRTSAGWLASVEQGWLFGPAITTLYLSTDLGATWGPISNPGNGFHDAGRTTLAVGAAGESTVYALTASTAAIDFDQGDIFRSTDGGQSWTALQVTNSAPTNPNSDNPNLDLLSIQAWYNQALLVDRGDPSRKTIYFGGQLASAKTTDGGATWKLTSNWLAQFGLPYVHADFHNASQVRLEGQDAIVFATDGGLSMTSDGAASFDSAKNLGLVDQLTYQVTVDPVQTRYVLTTYQDLGTRIRTAGKIYNQTYGGDGIGTAWSQANGKVALTTSQFGDIVYATRPPLEGSAWVVSPAVDACNAANGVNQCDAFFYTPLGQPTATADRTGNVFFTGTNHFIYRSDDGGAHFHAIYDAGANGQRLRECIAGHNLGVSPVDTQHLAAAGRAGRVILTSDGGASWHIASLIGTVAGWTGFNNSIAYGNNSTIYVGSLSQVGGATRVAKSSDGGVTWVAAGSGLPDLPLYQVLTSPADLSGRTAYAATDLGVYQTTDGGTSWHQFGAGLPTVRVGGMYISPDGDTVYAGTYGRGTWQLEVNSDHKDVGNH